VHLTFLLFKATGFSRRVGMAAYIIRRVLIAVPVFFLVTILVFLFLRLSPGDPEIVAMVKGMSPEQAIQLRHEMNLDRSLPEQYIFWLGPILHGNFGKSNLYDYSVGTLLRDRFPNTLRLGFIAILVGIVVGIPIGVLSAVKMDKAADYGSRGVAIMALAVPGFWLATLAIVVPAKLWGIGPPLKYVPWSENPWANFTFFLLPGVLLGLYLVGVVLRMTRSMMLEVLSSDYVRTARAKGLRGRVVLGRHALRNVLIPIITIIGTQAAWLIGGSVVMETIFGVPGIGALLVQSVQYKDFPVVQGVTIFLAGFVLAINLLVDVTYGLLDPRIRYR